MSLFSRAPTSLCILRLSAIGDCVNTVAVVQAIQRQWPGTAITWIMGKVEANLLGDLPGVEVLVYDKREGWAGYRRIWRQLSGRRFDALLHMQAALRASLLSLGIRARYRLGFCRERADDGQWLFTNHRVPAPAGWHVLDNLMGFAGALGVNDLQPQWAIPTSAQDDSWAQGQLGSAPTLLLSPSASKPTRNWTVDGYAGLIAHAQQCGLQVALCGGPSASERQLGEAICAACPTPPLNLIGQTNLKQLLALMKQARMVVSPDSGPGHMANAAGAPVLGLYADQTPRRTGPYRWQTYAVSVFEPLLAAQGKDPATLPWRTRLRQEDAMQHITLPMVIQAFDQLLAATTAYFPATAADTPATASAAPATGASS